MSSLKRQIDEVKQRLDIVEVVSEYIPLKRTGRYYRALCPFHSEKTPSFYVSPERQIYYCFGCGKHGDVINFVMEIEGISFKEALHQLAKRAGIELVEGSYKDSLNELSEKGKIYSVLEEALFFFRKNLFSESGKIAREYLKKRGIFREEAELFEIGWAPMGWDLLYNYLRQKGYEDQLILKAGLINAGKNGFYDVFRGRIIFPIRDARGNLLGFGGRTLTENEAKYINTPQTAVFSKKNVLYMLNLSKDEIRKTNEALLVEGYMDAIKLYVNGFKNTVASLGTSLTEEQVDLISKYAKTVVVCYDGDAAGEHATLRGLYLIKKRGLDVKIMTLPQGYDPDEYITSFGRESFKNLKERSLDLVDFHIDSVLKKAGEITPRKAAEIVDSMAELFAFLDSVEAEIYVKKLSLKLGVSVSSIYKVLSMHKARLKRSQKRQKNKAAFLQGSSKLSSKKTKDSLQLLEDVILFLLENKKLTLENIPLEDFLKMPISDVCRKYLTQKDLLTDEEILKLQQKVVSGAVFYDSFLHSLTEKELLDWVINKTGRLFILERYKFLRGKLIRGEATPQELKEITALKKVLDSNYSKVVGYDNSKR